MRRSTVPAAWRSRSSALPGQFLPWLIPAMGKWRERTRSAAVAEALAPWLDGRTTQVSWLGVQEEQA